MLRSIYLFIVASSVLLLFGCAHREPERKYITIMGAVNRPGVYFIKHKVPYILILMQARGYTDFADPTRVIVERNSKSVILDLNISKSTPSPHLAEKFMIYPYDVIVVPVKRKQRKTRS